MSFYIIVTYLFITNITFCFSHNKNIINKVEINLHFKNKAEGETRTHEGFPR